MKRADIESEREILKDEEKCYQELLKAGVMERPKTCSHCKSDQVKPSNTKRGTKAGLRFISCAKCHRYTNYVWFSPFRHCRTTPAEIYEFLVVYSRQSMLQRPTATDLNRILGWGRRKLGNMIDVCLKSESLLGFANNRKRILKNDTEVDAHALKRFYVSGRNPHFQHLQKIYGAERGPEVFQCHVRLAGICVRGGALCVSMLPSKLVSKKAPPPPESLQVFVLES